MTEFESLVSATLHERLDGVRSTPDLPASVARRAKRGRTLTASAGVLLLALLLGGSAWVGAAAFDRSFDPVGSAACPFQPTNDVTVYVRDDATHEQVRELGVLLTDSEGVERIDFVSKKQAFAEFKERYKDEPQFYENLPKDALPASFRVEIHDGVDPADVAEDLFGLPGVDEVRYGGRLIGLCENRSD